MDEQRVTVQNEGWGHGQTVKWTEKWWRVEEVRSDGFAILRRTVTLAEKLEEEELFGRLA